MGRDILAVPRQLPLTDEKEKQFLILQFFLISPKNNDCPLVKNGNPAIGRKQNCVQWPLDGKTIVSSNPLFRTQYDTEENWGGREKKEMYYKREMISLTISFSIYLFYYSTRSRPGPQSGGNMRNVQSISSPHLSR